MIQDIIPLLSTQKGKALLELVEHHQGNAFQLQTKSDDPFLTDFINLYHLRIKAKAKFEKAAEMVFTQRGYEQATSQFIAENKIKRIQPHECVLVLCSGIGGEVIALAARVKHVIAVDNDPEMIACLKWNAAVYSKAKNVTLVEDTAEHYVEQCNETFGAIFIDPDRRDGNSRKISIKDYSPNLKTLLPKLKQLSDRIYIKVSPGVSHEDLLFHFPEGKYEFIEENGVLKECWVQLLPKYKRPISKATRIVHNEIAPNELEVEFSEIEQDTSVTLELIPSPEYCKGKVLYEPVAAVMRAGAVETVGASMAAKKLTDKGALLLLETYSIEGRRFGTYFFIIDLFPYSKKKMKEFVKKNEVQAAEIHKRYFPIDIDLIKKTLKLSETGPKVLFFTTIDNTPYVIFGKRIGEKA